MRKFEFYVSTDKPGSEIKEIIGLDDNITDEEIEEIHEMWIWEHTDTGWVEVE